MALINLDKHQKEHGLLQLLQPQQTGANLAAQLATIGMSPYPLPKFAAAMSKVRAGTGNARVLFIGDSTGIGAWADGVSGLNGHAVNSWPVLLTGKLGPPFVRGSFFNDQGCSLGLGSGGPKDVQFKAYDTRVTYDSTWAIASGYGIGGYVFQSGGTDRGTFTFAPGVTHDRIDVYYTTSSSSAYGSFTVDIGAGTLQTINCNTGTTSVGKTTVTCASGINTVNIVKSTDGFVQLRGISCYQNNANAQIIVGGWNGMQAVQYLSGSSGTESATGPTADFPQIAPSLTFIALGINDSTGNATIDAFTYAINRIADFAAATGDVILCVPNVNSNANFASYRQAIIAIGAARGVNVVDFHRNMVDWTTANNAGLMADGRHPRKAGYLLMAEQARQQMPSW